MLSKELYTFSIDFVEKLEAQENLIRSKDETIQEIVAKCEVALATPKLRENFLKLIIEEYKEDI